MVGEREDRSLHERRRLCPARHERIVERWYGAISPHAFSPFAAPEILAHLSTLLERSISILTGATFRADTAEEIGAILVRLRYLDPATLRETIAILGEELDRVTPEDLQGLLRERLPTFLGAIAAGHARASRTLLLDEQEGVRAAILAERGRISASLRESEALFRAVFTDAAVGIALVGLDGRAIEWNPAVERILGYNRIEMSRLLFMDITHPDDIVEDRALFERLVAGEYGHYHKQRRYRHKQGHTVLCNLTASLLRDVQGSPRCVLEMIEDVTDRTMQLTVATTYMLSPQLTKREREVLDGVAQGWGNAHIATELCLAEQTVRHHISRIYGKIAIESRSEAIVWAREHGFGRQ